MGFAGDFPSQSPRENLYLWTASADSTQPDFLAVLGLCRQRVFGLAIVGFH
jgi:hypothetical protein